MGCSGEQRCSQQLPHAPRSRPTSGFCFNRVFKRETQLGQWLAALSIASAPATKRQLASPHQNVTLPSYTGVVLGTQFAFTPRS
jgi:hypothetical protein